jgi:hypothetical protein
MISSSVDMLHWGDALFSGDVLGEETTAMILQMRNFDPDLSTYYGLGVGGYCLDDTGCSPDEAEDLVGHSSSFAGTRGLLTHHPDSGTTTIVQANTNPPSIQQTIDLTADVLQQLGLT